MRSPMLVILTVVSVCMAATPQADATSYYWSGSGNSSDSLWATGSGGPYAYPWADFSDAYFEGAAGAVTIPGLYHPTANSLAFTTSGHTVTGGTLTLNAGSVSVVAGGTATINSVIAGSVGLIMSGAGTLVLSGANTYTGLTQVGPQWSGNGYGTLSVTGSIGNPAANTVPSAAPRSPSTAAR